MNRVVLITLSLLLFVALTPLERVEAKTKSKSESVVYINGARYYVHTIEKGDTMYSLSKLYGVEEAAILAANPMLGNGLRLGVNIKIPFESVVVSEELSERKERRTFEEYTVKEGETLYAISRKYELSVETLMNDNPQLDPASLSLGQVLKIRKAEQGKTSEEETQRSIEGYRRSLNSVAPAGLIYYVVVAGDDLESVASAHKMSVEQLKRVNHIVDEDDPAAGRMILVRDGASPYATAEYTAERQAEIESRVESVSFTALSPRDTLNVALLLPLSSKGRTMQPFVEFYQGALMGVERMKSRGRSVVVNLYNTERDLAKVRSIIAEPSYRGCELVIGPIYENLLAEVLRDAELRSVPVVSPLATIAKSDSPVLFQMAADPTYRYEKMDDLLGADRSVTFIEGEANDQSFKEEIMKVLASRDVEYFIHEYEYEHPSLIDDREREAEKRIKEAREFAEELGEELDDVVIDSLRARPSKSDLTPLLMGDSVQMVRLERDGVIGATAEQDSIMIANLIAAVAAQREKEAEEAAALAAKEEAKAAALLLNEQSADNADSTGVATEAEMTASDGDGEIVEGDSTAQQQEEDITMPRVRRKREPDEPLHHTFFVLSNDEVEVDRILSALSSAYAAQIAINRGSGRNIRNLIQYEVVANPQWRRYKNIDRSVYFRNKVVVFNSYVASREGDSVRDFDSRYGEMYGTLPSLYAYRGFDAMMIFAEGMYSDIQYDMGGRTYQPLQSKYRFERGEDRTMVVNTNWVRESYKSNFTKEIE